MTAQALQILESGHALDQLQAVSIHEAIQIFVQTKTSLATRQNYTTTLKQFFEFSGIAFTPDLHPSICPPSAMGRFALGWLESLTKRDEKSKERILNARTVNNKAMAVSSFFRWLVEVHNYPKNPIKAVFSPLKIKRKSTTQSLSRGEMVDLLAYGKAQHRQSEKKYRDYLLILFAFSLALRRSEIARIRIDDIGSTEHTPTIKIYRKGGQEEILPLPEQLASLVVCLLDTYPTTSHYLFRPVRNRATNDLEKPISTTGIFQIIRGMANTLFPDKKITPHSLRKSFVEISLNNGEEVSGIMNATGHSSVDMVNYYDGRDSLENNAIRGMAKFI